MKHLKEKKHSKIKKIIIIFLFIIIFLLFLFSVAFSIINMGNSNILKGICINGIDISNLSKDEALKVLTELTQAKCSSEIVFFYEDINNSNNNYNYTLPLSQLKTNYNISKAIDEAYSIGRSGNIFQNNFVILDLLLNGKNINLELLQDDNEITSIIQEISVNLPSGLIDNNYYIDGNNLIIEKGASGNVIEKDLLKSSIYEYLNDLTTTNTQIPIIANYKDCNTIDIQKIYNEIHKEAQNASYQENPFKVFSGTNGIDFDIENAKTILSTDAPTYTIPLIITKPDISITDLDINIFRDRLSTCTTKYDVRNVERTTNLELAVSKIDGTILSPGEEFSYNKTVGARTIAAGYKEAKVYENGQVVDGIGGGICQISSTLYNSVLFANLEITQRYKHQFITSYIQPGRDATVVYGAKDFKFKNTRSYPIQIKASVNEGIVRISIYGLKEEIEYDVSFDVQIVSTLDYSTQYKQDSSLPINTERIIQQGANGMIVNSYKVTKLNGIVISRDLISTDTYNALNKVVLQGTKIEN